MISPPISGLPLLVFADDWGRHPSSCQHLIAQLLPRRQVTWVNTIAMRPPRLDWTTLSRGGQKIGSWLRRPASRGALPENLRVANPLMWPWLTRSFDRRLNRSLLCKQLLPLVRNQPAPLIGVTTLPIVADLMDDLPVARWIYYCVDDFSQWPGLDSRTMEAQERRVVERADVVIAVSEVLAERMASMGRAAELLSHGVDLDHWLCPIEAAPLPILAGLERPLVVFWGLIDRRLDVKILRRTAAEMDRGTLLLVGPEQNADPELAGIPRLVRRPSLGFYELPRLAHEAAVLVMPYAELPVTRAMQPLKLKEYLATGKPTVVRDLPAAREWADALDLASSPDAFAAAVVQRISGGLDERQRRARVRLRDESWSDKARRFEELIAGTPLRGASVAPEYVHAVAEA